MSVLNRTTLINLFCKRALNPDHFDNNKKKSYEIERNLSIPFHLRKSFPPHWVEPAQAYDFTSIDVSRICNNFVVKNARHAENNKPTIEASKEKCKNINEMKFNHVIFSYLWTCYRMGLMSVFNHLYSLLPILSIPRRSTPFNRTLKSNSFYPIYLYTW